MRIAAVVIFLIATWVGAPARAERILNFVTEVALSREDEFSVTEKIRYDFGNLARHGIYRDIPVR